MYVLQHYQHNIDKNSMHNILNIQSLAQFDLNRKVFSLDLNIMREEAPRT